LIATRYDTPSPDVPRSSVLKGASEHRDADHNLLESFAVTMRIRAYPLLVASRRSRLKRYNPASS
jgi:hypothetical protein